MLDNPSQIKAHYAKAKANGWCVQCAFPWFDGLCDCQIPAPQEEQEAVLRAAGLMDERDLYLLTCELQGQEPAPVPGAPLPLPVLDRSPEDLAGLWGSQEND